MNVTYASVWGNIGTWLEAGMLFLMPFFIRRLGIKRMIACGILAWVVRYALFSWSATAGVVPDPLPRRPQRQSRLSRHRHRRLPGAVHALRLPALHPRRPPARHQLRFLLHHRPGLRRQGDAAGDPRPGPVDEPVLHLRPRPVRRRHRRRHLLAGYAFTDAKGQAVVASSAAALPCWPHLWLPLAGFAAVVLVVFWFAFRYREPEKA